MVGVLCTQGPMVINCQTGCVNTPYNISLITLLAEPSGLGPEVLVTTKPTAREQKHMGKSLLLHF